MTSTWQEKCQEILILGERGRVLQPFAVVSGDGGLEAVGGKISIKIFLNRSIPISLNIPTFAKQRKHLHLDYVDYTIYFKRESFAYTNREYCPIS